MATHADIAVRRGQGAWCNAALAAVLASALVACGGGGDGGGGDPGIVDAETPRANEQQPAASTDMQAVLNQLTALGARPLDTLTVAQARTQATPADAARAVAIQRGQPGTPLPVGSVEDRTITGPAGPIAVRIYKPTGTGPFPLLLYIHGGGWVIANIDTYDGSARALTNAAGAIVVSTHYRQAPEAVYPAAHDDTWAAWRWMVDNAVALGGSPRRVAVAGESAGGNMAASIALRARDGGTTAPVHQLLIYPVTGLTLDTPSAVQNRNAAPLNTASLAWFYDKYFPPGTDRRQPLAAPYHAPNLAGLAPATVITADIDPLRSEGRRYADRLQAAGVATEWTNYTGVTHEFFGMSAVAPQAVDAVVLAGRNLRRAYAGAAP